ncbi:AAA family ATPase [Breoghania sp.]|uniref:AAA family ATPase n=1 Tax=Breoghania sp. TaxID=2065378 RepID=UPI002AAADED5|nr:AAA family ATPase [Breoghania sp.]
MRRAMIIGQPGSGKSTLARALGQITDLPVIHIDQILWQTGWIQRSRPEIDALCLEAHARPCWIFEGGHSSTWAQRLERCDTLIWLDVPLARRLYRVLLRTLRHHGRTRPDLTPGCHEHFDTEFLVWMWNTRNSAREKMRRLYETAPADKALYRFTRFAEVDRFLDDVRNRVATS